MSHLTPDDDSATKNIRAFAVAPAEDDARDEEDVPDDPSAGDLLRAEWAAGRKLSVEQFLVEHPVLTDDPEAVFDLLHAEHMLRRDADDEPTLEEYRSRFPSHVTGLSRVFHLSSSARGYPPEDDTPPSAVTRRDRPGGSSPRVPRIEMPRVVAGYEILAELGRGGMGVVYKARHLDLGRTVALKMILSARFAGADELMRFRLEGEAAASLTHPNIVQVYEVGTFQDQPFLALEFVDGGSLGARIKKGRLTHAQAARLVEALARAVHTAHTHGIVHRDLKPANVLLATGQSGGDPAVGTPKITDFGLAKHLDRAGGLTETGRVLGTPEYMSPEQASGKSREIGPATDIYSLGAILYELLCGHPPFRSSASMDTMMQVLSNEATPLRRVDARIPRDLETICARCLEKDPKKRFATAHDLADDLARWLAGEPIASRPVGFVEYAAKWAARRPVIAGLLGALAVMTALAFVGISVGWYYALAGLAEADRRRVEADRERGIAQQERDAAEASAAYALLSQARLELRANNAPVARLLLDKIDPARRGWEWRYLDALFDAPIDVVASKGDPVVAGLDYSPDGSLLAIAWGNPYSSEVYSRRSGRVEVRPAGGGEGRLLPEGPFVRRARFDPKGRYLAVGDYSGAVRVYDAKTLELVFERGKGGRHVEDVAWMPDGHTLLAVRNNSTEQVGRVLRYEVPSGKELPAFPVSLTVTGRLAVSGDGKNVAVGGSSATVLLRSDTGKEYARVADGAPSLAASPDGTLFAATGTGSVRMCRFADGSIAKTLTGHEGEVSDAAFSADGKSLATVGADRTARVWDVVTGQQTNIRRANLSRVDCVAFHPDGTRFASGTPQPAAVHTWDLTRGDESDRIAPYGSDFNEAIAFDPTSTRLHLIRKGGLTEARDAASGRVVAQEFNPFMYAWRVPTQLAHFSRDASTLAFVDDRDYRRVVVRKVFRKDAGPDVSFGHTLDVWHVRLSPDGKHVLSCGSQRVHKTTPGEKTYLSELVCWDAATGKELWAKREALVELHRLEISPDGKTYARSYTVHDAESPYSVFEMLPLTGEGGHPPGPTFRKQYPFANHPAAIAFSADGALVAVGIRDGAVEVRKVATMEVVRGEAFGKLPAVLSLAFSPDGRLLAGANRIHVKLWSVADGQDVLALQAVHPPPYDPGFNPQLAWSPDGQRLACANWDNSVTVWNGPRERPDTRRLAAAADARRPDRLLSMAAKATENHDAAGARRYLALLDALDPEQGRAGREATYHLERVMTYGFLGRWEEAARHAKQVGVLGNGHFIQAQRRCAVALHRSGDRDAYAAFRDRLIAGCPPVNRVPPFFNIAELSAAASYEPLTGEAKAAMRRHADTIADFRGMVRWSALARVLAAYRGGDTDAAAREAAELAAEARQPSCYRVTAGFVLAAALADKGDAAGAAAALARAETALADLDREGRSSVAWWDRVEMETFCKEARSKAKK